MGRGRQKAKQTKVARALKYHSASIDVTALERELSGGRDEQRYDAQYRDAADDSDDDPNTAFTDGFVDDQDEASDYASPSRGR